MNLIRFLLPMSCFLQRTTYAQLSGGLFPAPPPLYDSRLPTPSPKKSAPTDPLGRNSLISPPPPTFFDPAVLNCLTSEVRLVTLLSVDAPGNPKRITEGDLEILGSLFQETYNAQGKFNCDGLFRRVESVKIQIFDFPKKSSDLGPVNVNFIFEVEFSCRGMNCLKPAVLFSQKNGFLGRGDSQPPLQKSNGGGRRNLQSDVCGECHNSNPSRRSPSPRQFVHAYRDAIRASSIAFIFPPTNIIEIEPQDCVNDGIYVNETVLIELVGDPSNITESDLRVMADSFLSSYNLYSDVECDGRFLSIQSVDIIPDPILIDETRRLAVDFFVFDFAALIFFLRAFIVSFCRNCSSKRTALLTNDASRERFLRTLESHGLRGRIAIPQHGAQADNKQVLTRRRAQDGFLSGPIAMEEYYTTIQKDCKFCPLSDHFSNLPGVELFPRNACFCAKFEVGIEGQKVGVQDVFNMTFQEEQNYGRFKGLKSFRGVQFMAGSDG